MVRVPPGDGGSSCLRWDGGALSPRKRIVDAWDFVEQNLLFPALLLQEIAHILRLANRYSQNFQPLLGERQLKISFPHHNIKFHPSGGLGEFLNTL